MARRRYTPEQIISMLRKAEVLLNKGSTVIEVSRKLGIAEQTYYRWRKDYGGMRVEVYLKPDVLEVLVDLFLLFEPLTLPYWL